MISYNMIMYGTELYQYFKVQLFYISWTWFAWSVSIDRRISAHRMWLPLLLPFCAACAAVGESHGLWVEILPSAEMLFFYLFTL